MPLGPIARPDRHERRSDTPIKPEVETCRRRSWRPPRRTQLALQRKGPNRITGGTPLNRVASGGDGDVLLAIDLINNGRRIGPEPGLEFPQPFAGFGVDGHEVSVRFSAKH